MSISFENSIINPLYDNFHITEIKTNSSDISDSDSEYTDSIDSDSECRICLENNNYEELITVCDCKGSVKYVHKSCIENWINSFPSNHINHLKCQLCKTNYNLDVLEVNVVDTSQNQRQFCITLTLIYFAMLIVVIICLLILSN